MNCDPTRPVIARFVQWASTRQRAIDDAPAMAAAPAMDTGWRSVAAAAAVAAAHGLRRKRLETS